MFNVVRNGDIPASLAEKRKYDSQDVYDALKRIFYDKCYICETKEPQDINVEHFDPHYGDEMKKFDWDNLYYACSRCNNIKSTLSNILDCCDPNIDMVRAIKHLPPHTPYFESLTIEAQLSDEKTQSTAMLLDKVFNSTHTPNKAVSSRYLRKKVFEQYCKFLNLQQIYFDEFSDENEKNEALKKMKLMLKASSPYTAFISWCVLNDNELKPLLSEDIGAQ